MQRKGNLLIMDLINLQIDEVLFRKWLKQRQWHEHFIQSVNPNDGNITFSKDDHDGLKSPSYALSAELNAENELTKEKPLTEWDRLRKIEHEAWYLISIYNDMNKKTSKIDRAINDIKKLTPQPYDGLKKALT